MTANISPLLLESLIPLRQLPVDALRALAALAEYEDFPARTVIFRKGTQDEWTRYLVSGSLLLAERADGENTLIGMGDSGVAIEPLGFEQPHPQSAIARTDVRLLRLPTARIIALLDEFRPPDYQVDEVDAEGGDTGNRLFFRLFQDLMEDKLALPSMPDIAVRVREAVADEGIGAHEVAKIIQADPVVAARVMQAANSALFAGQRQVDNLAAAIIRLGLQNTREVVMAVTMREVFRSKNPLINKRMVEQWMHSTLVAAIAAVLARNLGGFMADRALLAGLVHDIGVVPMLAHAGDYPELVSDPELLEATIAEYRGQIGTMLLRRWNFPEDLIQVPLTATSWTREHEGKSDYADLIVAAKLQSYAGDERYPALSEMPVYEKLGLAKLAGSDGCSILDEAREEIAEVQRMLIG